MNRTGTLDLRATSHLAIAPLISLVAQPPCTFLIYTLIGPQEIGRWAIPSLIAALNQAVFEVAAQRAELREPGCLSSSRYRALIAICTLPAIAFVPIDPLLASVLALPAISHQVAVHRASDQRAGRFARIALAETTALLFALAASTAVAITTRSAIALAAVPIGRAVLLAGAPASRRQRRSQFARGRTVPHRSPPWTLLTAQATSSISRNVDYALLAPLLSRPAMGTYFASYTLIVGAGDRLLSAFLRSAWKGSKAHRTGQPDDHLVLTFAAIGSALGALAFAASFLLEPLLSSEFQNSDIGPTSRILSLTLPAVAIRSASTLLLSNRGKDAANLMLSLATIIILSAVLLTARPESAAAAAAVVSLGIHIDSYTAVFIATRPTRCITESTLLVLFLLSSGLLYSLINTIRLT